MIPHMPIYKPILLGMPGLMFGMQGLKLGVLLHV